MTTAPKATRFRIRKETATPQPAAPDNSGTASAAPGAAGNEDGFGPAPFPGSAAAEAARSNASAPEATAIEAIRAEGLSGRQLRMARRVAAKHGFTPTSDFDAVRLLRIKGIDPFQPAQVLELVKPSENTGRPEGDDVHLPQTFDPAPKLPAPAPLTEGERAHEIMRIQRDIVRRRRRNFIMLMARLAVFVAAPTLVAGWYFFVLATPLYATKSEFLIQQAESQAAGIGSLFRGTQFATSQDSITVQSYLQSRDAMLRLNRDLGFKAHFSQPNIDPILRLSPDASNEAAYKLFRRNVKIGYDPTEGIVKMEVIAADPAVSQKFSEALISYAEEQVDDLTRRLRADQMQGARDSYEDTEKKVSAAQQRILDLQEKLGVLDPMTETSSVMGQVGTFETLLQKKRLELQQLLDNPSPNQARVTGVEGDIQRLETLIAQLRAPLTETTSNTTSLAQVTGQLRIAEADLETRQLMLSQALQQLEVARIEANRQVRYLSVGVSPVAPDEPTYPKAFEDTLLAFIVFGGIYLLMSLTASILREQVTA